MTATADHDRANLIPPAFRPTHAPQDDLRVGDRRRVATEAVGGGARPCARRCGPTRSAPPLSAHAMLPPPADTVWMSSIGRWSGCPLIRVPDVRPGCSVRDQRDVT